VASTQSVVKSQRVRLDNHNFSITITIASQEDTSVPTNTEMGVKPETTTAGSQELVTFSEFEAEADIEMPDVEKLRQLLPEEKGEEVTQLDIILQAISYIRSLQHNLHMDNEDR
jgi:hypothetical protein